MATALAILLRPFQDVNHPFVQNTHNLYTTQLLMEEKNKVYCSCQLGWGTMGSLALCWVPYRCFLIQSLEYHSGCINFDLWLRVVGL